MFDINHSVKSEMFKNYLKVNIGHKIKDNHTTIKVKDKYATINIAKKPK